MFLEKNKTECQFLIYSHRHISAKHTQHLPRSFQNKICTATEYHNRVSKHWRQSQSNVEKNLPFWMFYSIVHIPNCRYGEGARIETRNFPHNRTLHIETGTRRIYPTQISDSSQTLSAWIMVRLLISGLFYVIMPPGGQNRKQAGLRLYSP